MSNSAANHKQSLLLVLCCTLCGATAQVLMKVGAGRIQPASFIDAVLGLLTNVPLIVAYMFYGVSLILLTLALRHGELSSIYPIIALTYVWVGILSVLIFHEVMTPLKIAGLATIVFGVAIIGRGGRS
ncbi:MAG: cation/cationic drug transporter [Bryobacteraceae bacterium]